MSLAVLIADSDSARGSRVSQVCRRAGLCCEWVADGVAALARALEEPPALILARLPLPLVDGPKLAQILRANPRTQPVRFLFQGVRHPASEGGATGAGYLAPEDGPEQILSRVEAVLGHADPASSAPSTRARSSKRQQTRHPTPPESPPTPPTAALEQRPRSPEGRHIGPTARPEGLFDEAQARRLRGRLRPGGRRSGALTGRVVIVAADSSSVLRFARCLVRAPGAWLSPELQDGWGLPSSPTPIGHLVADERLGIELLLLPASRRFAPLWPIAAHRALGVFFLLELPVSGAMAALDAVAEGIGRLPGVVTATVLLVDSSDAPIPRELQEHPPRAVASSLFRLPTEGPHEPQTALRRLFSRVVP